MKYFEADFVISPLSPDAADLLAAIAGEAGFESFEETPTGLKGYVQQQLFDQEALQTALAEFPFDNVAITYTIREAEDRDWNEQWEQEGFDPIVLPGLIIHDGRHLPDSSLFTFHSSLLIEIDAHQAFGTGTHETTRMVCSALLEHMGTVPSVSRSHSDRITGGLSPCVRPPQRVLDCGTGTGILSICALKLGAKEAIGYDIDEWSVDNARHNAVINRVDDRFTSLLGDATILNKVEGTFDLVLANINRNILLADMPAFKQKMAPGATLILSGFYTADCPMLIEKAAFLGLTLQQQKEDHDWACLVFSFPS
jgi:ribosomal protein L11 methyltransferase